MAGNEWGQTTYPVVPGHEIVAGVTAAGNKGHEIPELVIVAGVGAHGGSGRESGVKCQLGPEQYRTVGNGRWHPYSARDS